MQETLPVDPLGDNMGVLENAFDDSTTVVNYYATDSYRNFCKMMYKWNQEGLIMPDATTTTENNLLSGNGFAMFENWKPGKELENYKSNGNEGDRALQIYRCFQRQFSHHSFQFPSS